MTLASADRITNTGGSPDNLKTGSDKYNAHKHERLYNYLFNSSMEIWGAGASAAPTGWTLTGAGASVAKNTTAGQFKLGAASAAVTRAGTDCYLAETVDTMSGHGPAAWWQSKEITLGCWVRATVASRARIAIYDGVGTTYSSYHTGGSSLEFLTVTRTLDAAATEVTARLYVDTGDTVAQFDGAILVIGPDVDDWQPDGWRGRKTIIILNSEGTGPGAGTTNYLYPFGHGTGERLMPAPYKGVARKLRALSTAAPGAGETFVYTFRNNGGASSLTSTTSNPSTSSSDLTNEVEVAAAGNGLGLQLVVSGGGATTFHLATFEYEEVP